METLQGIKVWDVDLGPRLDMSRPPVGGTSLGVRWSQYLVEFVNRINVKIVCIVEGSKAPIPVPTRLMNADRGPRPDEKGSVASSSEQRRNVASVVTSSRRKSIEERLDNDAPLTSISFFL